MRKSKALKQGDHVKIINPILVNRFGYPLNTKIIKNEFTAEQRKEVWDFFRKFVTGRSPLPDEGWEGLLGEDDYNKSPDGLGQVLHGLAYGILKARNHGGNRRQLYTQVFPELEGGTTIIKSRKVVKTGTRVPGSGGYCSYTGEYDYDPGYLADEKTHVLYEIGRVYKGSTEFYLTNDKYNILVETLNGGVSLCMMPTVPIYIEKINVESLN